MIKLLNLLKNKYDLVIITTISVWLRFVNLGYSDFQGDEIRAFFIPDKGQSKRIFF